VIRISTCIAAVLLLAVGLTAAAAEPRAKPPSKEQIAEWIKGLGSDSFDEREKASKALWKAGQAAEAALRQVLKDGDAEANRRAREILDKFDAGLYPDTPEAVTKLIDDYRTGTPEARAAAIPKLLDQGGPGYTALMKLASQEKDEMARALIWQILSADMPRLAAALLVDGQDARLQEILEQGLSGEGDAPLTNYAAYLLVRGKLDARLRELQKKAGPTPDKKSALTLAFLCRAKDDLGGARRYAEKAEHAGLIRTILIEQEDWRALLKQIDGAPAAVPGFLAPPVENPNGLRLACLRLAGDREGFEALLPKLPAETDGTVDLAAFLLNGRPDEALGWLTKQNDHAAAAELLSARLRYRDALDAADRPVPAEKGVDPTAARLFKAGLLARLGERKKAREIFDKVVAEAKPEQENVLLWIVSAEYNAGFKDAAFARAAAQLAKTEEKDDLPIVNLLFQPIVGEAGVGPWWTFLRHKYPKDDAAATLKRLRDLFAHKTPAPEAAALLKELAEEAAKLKPEEQEPALHCVAATCRALGREDLEETYLQKWAEAGGDARAWLRLGDVSAESKRWKDAAERYKRAWEKDRSTALTLYLHGRALVQAGQDKEGRRWMDVAQILPLGSDEKRAALARGLDERGLDAAAAQEWERLRRLTDFVSNFAPVAARSLAEKAIIGKEYLKASTYFRREGLHYLGQPYLEDVDGHLWLAIAEHRCRARAHAVAGRLDDMRKEVEDVLALQPGNIDLAIDLVPELVKRGKKKEADELFTRIYAVQDGVCKEYPKSGWSHNNTAWLAVRCRRDLDAALEHARQGVELEPDNAGHLDTLAEVYFQRGDKDKAVELMKKCIAMQPRYEYFRRQLKRMQAGDRDTDVPPEPTPGSSLR